MGQAGIGNHGGQITHKARLNPGGVHGALTWHLATAVRVSAVARCQALAGLTRVITVDDTGRGSAGGEVREACLR
ncbi:MAG TPA: hypothetical protein VK784_14470, partial [Pseudonocardiaceae bacterium]|nr:hypothetical protein [Pseudonocardiaceae bacterium]